MLLLPLKILYVLNKPILLNHLFISEISTLKSDFKIPEAEMKPRFYEVRYE